MRTNIVIDDALMTQAMLASGTLVKLQQQAGIRAFRGRLAWEGDLESQRLGLDRFLQWGEHP